MGLAFRRGLVVSRYVLSALWVAAYPLLFLVGVVFVALIVVVDLADVFVNATSWGVRSFVKWCMS
jgi:hypothetical protein